MTPEQQAEQERIRANEAQQLLDNRIFKEAFTLLEADCFARLKKTKFKESVERDEIWRKLQTIDQVKQIIERIVTTGKMQEPKFTDKIFSIRG